MTAVSVTEKLKSEFSVHVLRTVQCVDSSCRDVFSICHVNLLLMTYRILYRLDYHWSTIIPVDCFDCPIDEIIQQKSITLAYTNNRWSWGFATRIMKVK